MKKNDLIMVIVVLAIAIVGFVAIKDYQNQEATQTYVVIKHDGKVIEKILFNAETESQFEYAHGDEYNTIVIKDGLVTVEEASCRDQICVKTKSISKNGEIIVCLPHKLTVEIYAESSEIELDGIAE
jgi:hypothetical protein